MATTTTITARELSALQTERINTYSSNIDQVSTLELCRTINHEDATIAGSVEKCIPVIAGAVDSLAARVRKGGRVVYVGAGTSGRLGILDASEIPPTFSSPEGQFIGLIAGGESAIRHAQEGAEDDIQQAIHDLSTLGLQGSLDSLIGIAASGRTPYVLSCLSHAKSLGCLTIGVACTEPSAMSTSGHVDFMINAVVGPEVVTGSTRLKAGTATKLVLNMLSTGTMIRMGKTYGNMMVDLKATNLKLQYRSRNILRTICGSKCPDSDDELDVLLKMCQGSVKLAIAVLSLSVPVSEAKHRLDEAGGVLAIVLKSPVNGTVLARAEENLQEYVLCVDGGGSKCAASIMSADGQIGYGEGPGCNVTDVGVKATIASISAAVQQACDSHPKLRGKPQRWSHDLFSSIWVALAGHDRKEIAASVDRALETLFKRPRGKDLMITNDIELLAISTMKKGNAPSAVVLVAGTGSVAMCYTRSTSAEQFIRVGRTGGWGYLLGDDGSGFDIGRQGIRTTLAALDDWNNNSLARNSEDQTTAAAFKQTQSPLVTKILDHFQSTTGTGPHTFDLLSSVLLSAPSELAKKKGIAQVARLVIESVAVDAQAKRIIDDAVGALVRLLLPLTRSGKIDALESTLVLAGGLMQSKDFSDALRKAVSEAGERFKHVEVVTQPSAMGAECLLQTRR